MSFTSARPTGCIENLSNRIEVATPVSDARLKERLWEVLDVNLRDCRQAWILENDGNYQLCGPAEGDEGPAALGTHEILMQLARARGADS